MRISVEKFREIPTVSWKRSFYRSQPKQRTALRPFHGLSAFLDPKFGKKEKSQNVVERRYDLASFLPTSSTA